MADWTMHRKSTPIMFDNSILDAGYLTFAHRRLCFVYYIPKLIEIKFNNYIHKNFLNHFGIRLIKCNQITVKCYSMLKFIGN